LVHHHHQGCGIEYVWGLAKKYYRNNIKADRKKLGKNFEANVVESLGQATVDFCRKCNNRVYRFMLAYKHYDANPDDLSSYEDIQRFVNKIFKSHRSAVDQDSGWIINLLKEIVSKRAPE
jgi:hypothetical protein